MAITSHHFGCWEMRTSMRRLSPVMWGRWDVNTRVGEEDEGQLFVCGWTAGWMDGENERERTSKDIFIRIILQPRISSGKVAQCLPITQTRRHRHTQTQCRRRLQKLEKLYFTSVCPGKPLFKAACYTPLKKCCWMLWLCVCAQVICLLSSLNLSGFPPTWFYCLFIVYLQTPAHPRCTAARRKALIAACCFVFCSYTWKLEARGLIKKVLRSCT